MFGSVCLSVCPSVSPPTLSDTPFTCLSLIKADETGRCTHINVKLLHLLVLVEFPAVLLNTSNGEIEREFHHYVQPQENPILSDFCREFTGITQVLVVIYMYEAVFLGLSSHSMPLFDPKLGYIQKGACILVHVFSWGWGGYHVIQKYCFINVQNLTEMYNRHLQANMGQCRNGDDEHKGLALQSSSPSCKVWQRGRTELL